MHSRIIAESNPDFPIVAGNTRPFHVIGGPIIAECQSILAQEEFRAAQDDLAPVLDVAGDRVLEREELGLAAIDVTRPLPFTALPRPALGDLARDLLRKRDSDE